MSNKKASPEIDSIVVDIIAAAKVAHPTAAKVVLCYNLYTDIAVEAFVQPKNPKHQYDCTKVDVHNLIVQSHYLKIVDAAFPAWRENDDSHGRIVFDLNRGTCKVENIEVVYECHDQKPVTFVCTKK